MDTARKKEILSKAKEINDLSEQYQLIHATYASQEYIKGIIREYYQERLSQLKERISTKALNGLDTSQEMSDKKELEQMIKRNRYTVNIDYIDVSNEDTARIVKVGTSFTIYLAKSLKDKIIDQSGAYNYKIIRKIRRLMGHEIGHIVLHTKELLIDESTQGSLTIKDDEKELEADAFGEKLLELRRNRNKRIREDGGAENLF